MNVGKIVSIAFAVLGGLAILAIIVGAVWIFWLDDTPESLKGTMPHEEAATGDIENRVAVNLHFGHKDRTPDELANLEVVERTTSRSDLIAYTLEAMIEGPSEEEEKRGFYSELELASDSQSTCGGDDFQVDEAKGTFLVQICRETTNFGSTSGDVTALSQVAQTLSQFPDVERTVVLGPQENCLGEPSDDNQCYEDLPDRLTP